MQVGVGAAEDGRPSESGKHVSRRKTLFRRLTVFNRGAIGDCSAAAPMV
jgi:hypothetical protein